MSTTMKMLHVVLLLICLAGNAFCADSASVNPLNVVVTAQSDSVPVGTIITWPVSSNPAGWEQGKWLECNGQGIAQSIYPELYAIVGGTIPDYRGLFLRGFGSGKINGNGFVSAPVGEQQNYSTYSEAGTAVFDNLSWYLANTMVKSENGHSQTSDGYITPLVNTQSYNLLNRQLLVGRGGHFFFGTNIRSDVPVESDIVIQTTPGVTETRPVNKTVRYLIRAKY